MEQDHMNRRHNGVLYLRFTVEMSEMTGYEMNYRILL